MPSWVVLSEERQGIHCLDRFTLIKGSHITSLALSAFSQYKFRQWFAEAGSCAQVAGIMDKKKDCPEQSSNHEEILQGFKDNGYTVTFRTVDPTEANIPCTRARLHYLGVREDLLPAGSAETFRSELANVWAGVVAGAAKGLPKPRLDKFLFGDARDVAL